MIAATEGEARRLADAQRELRRDLEVGAAADAVGTEMLAQGTCSEIVERRIAPLVWFRTDAVQNTRAARDVKASLPRECFTFRKRL
ncbi:hypothetical protein GCM10011322_21310 [Salinarimonas ramus]|uniref:Uncharacterized protein n=1 Tax=Salinarimonas ramus TaxID=690164 RepID=A0A917V3G0_9HYPH|nr:hypothetical protein GCM10011322_21310 [Salinarimonas ramus]